MNPIMRAKLKCNDVVASGDGERLVFNAVCKSEGYPADGTDENNSFAKWTPSADLTMYVNNPALKGKIVKGDTFYVDFTKVE